MDPVFLFLLVLLLMLTGSSIASALSTIATHLDSIAKSLHALRTLEEDRRRDEVRYEDRPGS